MGSVLRVQYVAGYEAGRAATVAQWADHMKRMNDALLKNSKPPNVAHNRMDAPADSPG